MRLFGQRHAVAQFPAFFEQPSPFPHIPSALCVATLHLKNLLVNVSRSNVLSFEKSHH
jgi:hypothetical protein